MKYLLSTALLYMVMITHVASQEPVVFPKPSYSLGEVNHWNSIGQANRHDSLVDLATTYGFRWRQRDENLWVGQIKGFSNTDGTIDQLLQAALLLSIACHADQKAVQQGVAGWYLRLWGDGLGFTDPVGFILKLTADKQHLLQAEFEAWGAFHQSGEFVGDCLDGDHPAAKITIKQSKGGHIPLSLTISKTQQA